LVKTLLVREEKNSSRVTGLYEGQATAITPSFFLSISFSSCLPAVSSFSLLVVAAGLPCLLAVVVVVLLGLMMTRMSVLLVALLPDLTQSYFQEMAMMKRTFLLAFTSCPVGGGQLWFQGWRLKRLLTRKNVGFFES